MEADTKSTLKAAPAEPADTTPARTDKAPAGKPAKAEKVEKVEKVEKATKDTNAPSGKTEKLPKPSLVKARKEPAAELPRTPASSSPVPEPDADGRFDVDRPDCYLNRELTWLRFNFRVLHEAADERNPLLERVKFLAIVSSNLDEFFMKRIGGLKQQVGAGLHDKTVDGRSPGEQIEEAHELIRRLEDRQREVFLELMKALQEKDIHLARFSKLSAADQAYLREYYIRNIYPLVTPQATDPAHPFPFISNLSLNLLVQLHHPKESTTSLARVKVPVGAGIPRLLKLADRNVFVPLESVMANNLDLLFPEMTIDSCEQFRVTRNANTELEEDQADDLLAMIETELRERKFAPVVRLQVAEGMSTLHRGMLAAELGLDEHADVFEVSRLMAVRDLMEMTAIADPSLRDLPHHPIDHPALTRDRNIFHVIRDAGSILLHHPYDSYATSVERFLKEASRDPKVRAIKMSLYRTSAKSKVIHYLSEAARNGKQVAVVVELKARFDEAANIQWANRMGEMGIHVTYGVVGLKTHCKVILVVRQDYTGLRRYAHIGTGNYHAVTARLYSDLGLLTSDDEIGADVTELFNYLTTGYRPKRNYRKILPAPKILKRALLDKIEREVTKHTAESPGLIRFKMNALEDAEITRALYSAAQAGVRVDLIVRDTCRLRPGIPGLSENVRVVSIVGRFLEHARLFHFRNGGDDEYFIGSADCMKRNLDSRVELVAPVENEQLRAELSHLLDTQLDDRRSAWEMHADGSYVQLRAPEGKEAVSSQQTLIERAEQRLKEATRLRRRRPRGLRNH